MTIFYRLIVQCRTCQDRLFHFRVSVPQHPCSHLVVFPQPLDKSVRLRQDDDQPVTAILQRLSHRDRICDTAVIIFFPIQLYGREKHGKGTGGAEHRIVVVHLHGILVLRLPGSSIRNSDQTFSLIGKKGFLVKRNQFIGNLIIDKIQSEQTPLLPVIAPAHITFIIAVLLYDLKIALRLLGYIRNPVCDPRRYTNAIRK